MAENLWQVLETEYEITGRLLDAIKSTYEPCCCTVRTGHPHDKWFNVNSGVKQGSVLSPILFIAYLDSVLKKVNHDQTDRPLTFGYADDICHLETSIAGIQSALQRYDDEFNKAGMKMNKESGKTEILPFGRKHADTEVIINGDTIGKVEQAKYLGAIVTKEAGHRTEITTRITKFSQQAAALHPILRDKIVSLEVKRTIFNTILKPILLYGSESWVLTKKDLSRLEAAEMRVVRTMLDKSRLDKIRNTHLRNMLGITSVADDIERSALRWLGHVQRMNPDRIPKMAFDLKLKGKRPPGRPRKRWRDNVQEILTHRRIGRLERLEEEGVFLDRKEWKRRSELTGTKAYLGMM
ncbi:hypothetical protein Bbelb_398270 [Branchiostoma belcheri]|nr:hypothetical protein Bbelb_398270 [Branchiostoma belcheri]